MIKVSIKLRKKEMRQESRRVKGKKRRREVEERGEKGSIGE